MDAILLVGGFGTRLLPLTKTRPKPLIPLANMPFVERTVHWLRDAGIDHIILSLHYNADQFMSYFSRLQLDVDISFAVEGSPLGTGGAIKNCEPFLRSSRCFIFNGDIFTDLHLPHMLETHEQVQADVSLALVEVEDPSRFGVIETDAAGRIHTFTEKPPRELARSRDINAGIYIFERHVFDEIPGTPCSVEREIFPRLLQQGYHLHGMNMLPYWTDLGTPDDYMQAHRDILARKVQIPLSGREVSPGIWVEDQVSIAETALIRPPVILGHGVTIGAGATVGPGVVLGPHVIVEEDALVEDSILWEHVNIQKYSIVQGSIIGRGSDVSGTVQQQVCEDYARLSLRRKRMKINTGEAAA